MSRRGLGTNIADSGAAANSGAAVRYSDSNFMHRRTLLQWMAGLAGVLPFTATRAWAQTASFPGEHAELLRAVAAVVLPSSLGRAGTDRVAARFERYVREYRPGADTDHGYGFTHVRPKPASPAPLYRKQLAALQQPVTREEVQIALEQAQVKDLPRIPDGKSVIADLMSFYYRGSDANDLCYRAAIERDACRGLAGSDQPPTPLKERG